jgi:nitroreductase
VQTGKISEISAQVAEAWRIDLQQPEIMLEMLKVTRIGRREIEHYRDGIAIQGFLPELAERLGMFPRDRVPEQNSAMMKSMREMGEQQASSAAGWVWLVTTGNSRSQQIAAGRAFVRLHLRATQLGIALQPMSQALEDYPAMIESQQKLYQVLTVTPEKETVQMLARIGYADPAPLSPRRNLPDLVI